jgi:transcriptional regulator with XRE-family HTH domain
MFAQIGDARVFGGSTGNLVRYREKAKLTVAQLAKLCDVAPGVLYNIEAASSGHERPSLELLKSLSRELKISVDDLIK